MANLYVRSGGNGGSWTVGNVPVIYATLALALVAVATGDTVFLAEDHAETSATAQTFAFPGTPALPNLVLCANHSGSFPPVAADLATTATVTVTGSNNTTIGGCVYIYGVTFNGATTGASLFIFGAAAQSDIYLKNCAVNTKSTSNNTLQIGSGSSAIGTKVTWDNTTYSTAVLGGVIQMVNGLFIWKNTPSAVTGTSPTSLITSASGTTGTFIADGVDFSAMSGKTLIVPGKSGTYYLNNCKLPASITISSRSPTTSTQVFVSNTDSGGANYRLEKPGDIRGDQTTEITIVRTIPAGASMYGQAVSAKLVTTANASLPFPFESNPLVASNAVVGSTVNVTIYGVWGGGAVPTNDDIFIRVNYLGTSGSTLHSVATTGRATPLTPNANNPSDTSTWNGGTTAYKMTVAITPQAVGEIYVTVCVGVASETHYIDPRVYLS